MLADGDDAGRCANGLTAQKYREATVEERAIYRKWLRGTVVVYGALLMTGLVAVATYSGTGRTQLTDLSVRPSASSPRAN
jgi:hypothetical protein